MLFFDLDGPLVDVAQRYQTLHCDLLKESTVLPLDPGIYWQYKRQRWPEAAILKQLGASAIEPLYTRRRLELIETDAYLDIDQRWPWTALVLTVLARWYPLILVTLRSNRDALKRQLARLDLNRF